MALIGVYLHERAGNAVRLVAQAEAEGIRVALWSLDTPHPDLLRVTAGVGPGMRTELLDRLWEPIRNDAWDLVLVVVDDVAFESGALRALIRTTAAGDFGVAQPAHDRSSWTAFAITARRPFRIARETTWVDSGPAFVVASPWIDAVALPCELGHGLGDRTCLAGAA